MQKTTINIEAVHILPFEKSDNLISLIYPAHEDDSLRTEN
jgi:hypothetical protein